MIVATYRKKKLSQYNGRYHRMVGKVLDAKGQLKSRRFLLGTDERAAELAVRRLEVLWSEIEADFERRQSHAKITQHLGTTSVEIEPITGELIENPISVLETGPIWEPHTLAMAEVIRKGGNEIHVLPAAPLPRTIVQTESLDYIARIMNLRDRYSVISFVPSDPALYAAQLRAMSGRVEAGLLKAELHAKRTKRLTEAAVRTRAGQTLYAAFKAYAEYAQKSGHGGANEPKDVKSLKRAVQDMHLSDFKYDEIQQIGDYWRSRPVSRRHGAKGAKISVETVRGRLKTASRFVRWLSRSSAWDWQAPVEWDQALKLDVSKILTEEERLAVATGPETWTDEELVTLYSYATDRERLLILLGLNFGFAASEIRTFRHEDIKADLDPPRIARLRSKRQRYFEAAVWPETQQALSWLKTQQVVPNKGDAQWVVLNAGGGRYTSGLIAGAWKKLYTRVKQDHEDFRWLPFKFLRKTAYQLVLEASGSEEVAGAFQGRSKISSDEYASSYGRRLFGQVHKANNDVRARLHAMFIAAPDAFKSAQSRPSNISKGRRDEIKQLHSDGVAAAEIARRVGVSRATVYRWIA